MLSKVRCIFITLLLFAFQSHAVTLAPSSQSPTNIVNSVQIVPELRYYHDSGQYDRDIQTVATQAQAQLTAAVNKVSAAKKLAIVLDIDETSLSNWEFIKEAHLAPSIGPFYQWILEAKDTAIVPTLKLYQYAIQHNVAVFFITGRNDSFRAATIKNLNATGFGKYQEIYFRSAQDAKTGNIAEYKTKVRALIEAKGYDIVLNLGDQYSDLCGGTADTMFKYPNPFYFVPGCKTQEVCQWLPKDPYYPQNWAKVCPIFYHFNSSV
jgi:predicted secreted acid phosphatase